MIGADKVKDAQAILAALILPKQQQNQVSALVLLALADIKPKDKWAMATRASKTVVKGIMNFIETKYEREYAENTRETIRRRVLHQLIEAGVIIKNPDNPALPTNSSNTHYALVPLALEVVQSYGTANFSAKVSSFLSSQPRIKIGRGTAKCTNSVSITMPDGQAFYLSPGKHSKLQKSFIDEFIPRFVTRCVILYLGDTATKALIVNDDALQKLGITYSVHDKLPDILFLDITTNRLFVVEIVTSHGPVSTTRFSQLEKLLGTCCLPRIYVTAFLTLAEFKKHLADIAWDTEVWIAEIPEHMVHFNGPKFLK